MPQALRRILPVLASTRVSLFKDTSLVSVIAVSELAYVAMQVRAQTFRVLEMLTAMAAIFNIAMNLTMIPAYGIAGAAITSSITYASLLGSTLLYFRKTP